MPVTRVLPIAVGGILAMVAGALSPGQAHAIAIDGDWCRLDRNFKIEGPKIRTYNGSTVTGDYEQHAFKYLAPSNEPEAGTEVFMILRSEETLYLLRRAPGQGQFSDREAWQRCKVTS